MAAAATKESFPSSTVTIVTILRIVLFSGWQQQCFYPHLVSWIEQHQGQRKSTTTTTPTPVTTSFCTCCWPKGRPPFRPVWMFSTVGQFEHSQDVLNHLRDHTKGIRAVVLVGDIAYPDYDGRKWDTFFDFLDDQSNFDEIPLMIAAGNHVWYTLLDIDKQWAGNEIFLAYEHRFRMPRLKPPELDTYEGDCKDGNMNMDAPPYLLPYEWGNSYYAFTYGPARHVIVNAYSDMSPNSTQYKWLDAELASIDRSKTPWVLLTIHPPLYNTFALHHHDPQIFAAQEHLEPLFVKYHVNPVLTGHIHAYQRTDYVAVTDTGPMHITIGAGGRKCDAPFTNKEPEEWIKARDASMFGYGRITIHNETHAEWRWIPITPSELHDFNQVGGEGD